MSNYELIQVVQVLRMYIVQFVFVTYLPWERHNTLIIEAVGWTNSYMHVEKSLFLMTCLGNI